MKAVASLFLIPALLAGAGAFAQSLPSGEEARLYDLVFEPQGALARFRFVVPNLAARAYDDVVGDLPWLCAEVALPELAASGWVAETVIVSIGDREVPFGEMDAEAVQYFEAFRIASGACVLEIF